jgi:TonB family protein
MVALVFTALCGFASAEQAVVDRNTKNRALNDYALLTRDAIQNAWTTPLELAVPDAIKGRIQVNYVIRKNGGLEKVELVKGSGNSEMDGSLLAAIRAASPFPAIPAAVKAGRVLIRANFIVADVPSTKARHANHEQVRPAESDTDENQPEKRKYHWGRPAGNSTEETPESPPAATPEPEPRKKLKWGM